MTTTRRSGDRSQTPSFVTKRVTGVALKMREGRGTKWRRRISRTCCMLAAANGFTDRWKDGEDGLEKGMEWELLLSDDGNEGGRRMDSGANCAAHRPIDLSRRRSRLKNEAKMLTVLSSFPAAAMETALRSQKSVEGRSSRQIMCSE